MAAASHSASASDAAAQHTAGTVADSAAVSDEAAPAGRRRSRIVRPRIDIDDQIREANRVSDLLKKMGQAAKTLKKTQTKAKQRLIKKAARLSPQDLERIAVLKRVFGEEVDPGSDEAASSSSSFPVTSPPPVKGISAMHQTLNIMMKDVVGADDVVKGLGFRYSQKNKQTRDLSGKGEAVDEFAGGDMMASAKMMKRLPSLKRLSSAVSEANGTDGAEVQESQTKAS